MRFSKSRIAVSALALALTAAVAAPAVAAPSSFSRTVFFGDSLTDSGHFRPVLVGINPQAGVAGRFTTNPGLVWAEFLSLHYGTDATANGNGQGGDNYAVGGARVATDSVGALGATPAMTTQLAGYLAANGGRADANALYTVWGGANDLFAVAAGAPAQTTIGQAVAGQVGMVSSLKLAGAQYVLVPNLPDIGITPQFLAAGPAAQAQATGLAMAYNNALYGTLAAQGLEVIPLDTFGILRELAANPAAYGFANATGMACQSGQSISCVPTEFVTPDAANSYVFADGVHPTTRTHEILAQYTASVIDGARTPQLVARSAQASARARMDQVATHLNAEAADGTHWWGGLRADQQRYAKADLFDGVAPSGLFGVDWIRDGRAAGVFAGYGQMDADLGNSGGEFRLSEATLGGFASWRGDGLWANGQVSYSWLDVDTDRQVNLGPAQRSHRGSTDGTNLAVAVNVGWEFGEGALRHGPVVGVTYQDISLDGFAEKAANATALGYADTELNSFVGRVGWQMAFDGGQVQPYARLTWDTEFEDDTTQARAMLLSQSQLGYYRTPGVAFDTDYGTALAGARFAVGGLHANVGMSTTFGVSGRSDTSVFASFSGNW